MTRYREIFDGASPLAYTDIEFGSEQSDSSSRPFDHRSGMDDSDSLGNYVVNGLGKSSGGRPPGRCGSEICQRDPHLARRH
jgi:hypothetical protein